MSASVFQTIFLVFLLASTALQVWLKTRQIRHVKANRAQVPSDFSALITLAEHHKAADYTVAKAQLARWMIVWDSAVLAALTLGGVLGWLDEGVRSLLGQGIVAGLALIAGVTALSSLLNLPFSIYMTFGLEARFGFNQTTAKLFVQDLLKSTLLGAALGLPLLALLLFLMDQAGSLWWLYGWGVWALFSLLMLAIYPTWIAPLFNTFKPLDQQDIKQVVDKLLDKCGFASRGVLVMDGSKRSSHGNAYFTGFGRNRRIVFFDTLLERLSPVEIEAVLAHELGHYKCKHIIKRMLVIYAGGLATMALLGLLKDVAWFYQGLGVNTPSTAAALLLFFLAMPVFTFVLSAPMSYSSRKHEYEADAYAASVSEGTALISGLSKLYRDNAATLTPDPLHSLFYDSHPSAALRIAALRTTHSK